MGDCVFEIIINQPFFSPAPHACPPPALPGGAYGCHGPSSATGRCRRAPSASRLPSTLPGSSRHVGAQGRRRRGIRRHASLLLQAPGAPRLGPFPEAFPVPFANLHLLNQRRKGRWLCSEGTVSFHGCISSDHDRDLGRRGQGCGWGALKVGCPPAEPAGPVRRK